VAIGLGIFLPQVQLHSFVIDTLGYQSPPGFFGFNLQAWPIVWLMSSMFWVGVIFGTLGKVTDYILIGIFFIFTSFVLLADNITLYVYSGLIGTAILGNLIGFALKLLRKRIWK
jgi:hypothetical protein